MIDDKQIAELDKILSDLGESNTVRRLREKASDSGHLSEELIARYHQGEIEGEEQTLMRRHLLFCDSCSDLLLSRGGEVEDVGPEDSILEDLEAPRVANGSEPELAPAATVHEPIMTRRQAIQVCLGLGVMVITAVLAYLVATNQVSFMNQGEVAEVETMRSWVMPVRQSEDMRRGFIRAHERFGVVLREVNGPRRYVYFVLICPDGKLRALDPRGKAAASLRTIKERNYFPKAVFTETTEGWSLRDVVDAKVGERFGLLAFINPDRIVALEDGMATTTTLPGFEREYLAGAGPINQARMEALARSLRQLGWAEELRLLHFQIEQ